MANDCPRKCRIMIVEDDFDVALLYEHIDQIEGMLLTIQTGALGALAFLDKLNYHVDAVVTDLSMSDMSGLGLTKEIRRQEDLRGKQDPIKIFWCTGYSLDDTLETAKQNYGVIEVFQKPIDPLALVQEVQERIGAL